MGTDPAPGRSLLRQLPFPAKLVVTAFLIAVGLGYFSALVQLHMKHSDKAGEALPTMADVVARFAGVKQFDPTAAPPTSTIEQIIKGNRDEPKVSKTNMAPAFFKNSDDYADECKERGKTAVDFDREGELRAMIQWTKADPALKKKAYADDNFPLPDFDPKAPKPLTKQYAAAPDLSAVKIKSLVENRCQRCHESRAPSLGKWEEIEPLVTPPSTEVLPGNWVRTNNQIPTENLVQSTHAHLLSFAVLFSLTGFVFACSGYPTVIRCLVAPVVVVAQVSEIGCWWLARVPDYGPTFAKCIIMTGGLVGSGLGIQIIFGILDLYHWKGKVVVLLLFALGVAGVGVVGLKVIEPALKEQREAAQKPKEEKKPDEKKSEDKKPEEKPKPEAKKPDEPPAEVKVSHLERLVMGPAEADTKVKFNGKGTMAPAFFGKSDGWKDEVKERGKDTVEAERKGEQLAVQAWIRAEPADREKAFQNDYFTLPNTLRGKPVTKDYLDGSAVKVKTLLTDRCMKCHSKDGSESDFPLETYAELMKYIPGK